MDGNAACAHAAYALSEVAAIYPITPSSVMADVTDKYSCQNKKNIFGSPVEVFEMQSEAGAAGTVHGALAAGTLATTFTSSQGLLLMIPNMYKMAGELLPSVIHAAARTVAAHALSIFGDHSDVYACRQTGYTMLSSNNPQEAFHMALIAHLSAIKSHVPFLHFFDGFRTSHEIQKIELLNYDDIKNLVDYEELEKFRKNALNPETPIMRGTAQNDDVYFQNREACNKYYDNVPDIVSSYMEKINNLSDTNYKPFEYYGANDAEKIIVAMGSVCETIEETIDYMLLNGEKVGLIKVRLYRPFSAEYLLKILPETVKKISVLDRTKESGSIGEPLYLDVLAALQKSNRKIELFSGRYGLSSKNTTPSQIFAVYENMDSENPKKRFTVGINDDVTHLSLKISKEIITAPSDNFSCKFWGIGSDGTVGAAKNTIKIIGDNTEKYVQGFFQYDSKKSGGVTISHLRFANSPIKSTYYVDKANFVACHTPEYIYKYNIVNEIKPGGSFLLNCSWNENEIEKLLPNKIKKYIAQNNINFYTVNATDISRNIGLGGRINIVLQAAFFKISKIIDEEKALSLIKNAVTKTYSKKGEQIVKLNHIAAEKGMKSIKKINVHESWKNIPENDNSNTNENFSENKNLQDFMKNIVTPINSKHGDDLPVSAFLNYVDGTIPLGTSAFEKRSTASFVPKWIPENCIQCGFCSLVCPHACIRINAINNDELSKAPENFKHKKMIGVNDLKFSVAISPKDCTGCENCVKACPGLKQQKALEMSPIEDELSEQATFDYSQKLSEKATVLEKFKETTVKGSQFKKPLLEFSGACAGCGETPYAKLATQLFGDKMIIANATGCSSIWGGSFPSSPYTTDNNGKGPAWQNSLFEDNAEFGFGIVLAQKFKRNKIKNAICKLKEISNSELLNSIFDEYLNTFSNTKLNDVASKKLINYLENEFNPKNGEQKEISKFLLKNKNDISKKSVWLFGGDGWAYDIGFGGLDHVIASGENVNILVFDTEVYSNTGGQASKATPKGAIAQFASTGKKTPKKDLAEIAMSYKNVYVAKVALGADYNQCLKVFNEAENYDGPSIIIAYSPCINHGIKGGMKNSMLSAKQAVESGYWNLLRYNPNNPEPLSVDNKEPKLPLSEFLESELRFKSLKN